MDREESLFDQAVKRLDRAISLVEQKLATGSPAMPGSDSERERLARELAGAEASAALAKAIEEINAALEPQSEDA